MKSMDMSSEDQIIIERNFYFEQSSRPFEAIRRLKDTTNREITLHAYKKKQVRKYDI